MRLLDPFSLWRMAWIVLEKWNHRMRARCVNQRVDSYRVHFPGVDPVNAL
jgi:hypothetical protein